MVADSKKISKKFNNDWENEPTFDQLNNDVIGMSGIQETIRANILTYKELKEGGKKISVQAGKSDMRPLLVRKQQEWKYPALEEPFLNTPRMFQITPRTAEDEASAKQNGILINYQYGTLMDKTKLVGDIVRTFVDEGTVIVKSGWEAEYKTKTVQKEVPVYASAEESMGIIQEALQSGQMSREQAKAVIESGKPMQIGTEIKDVEEEVLVKNQPTHEVLDGANVGIDPTCEGDLSKAQFVWHEYETSFAELMENQYDSETGHGYYRNIGDAIAKGGDGSDYYDLNSPDKVEENFKFTDKARKKLKAVEYWGYWDINNDGKLVGIVAEWVNGVLVRLEKNPFPHGRLPFSIAYNMPVLRSTRGEPDAELIAENQEAIGKLVRAAHDISSTNAVGQEFIDTNLFVSQADKNQYEKGNTVYVNSGIDVKRAIHRRSVDPIDPGVFNMIQANTQEAETLTGTKPFNGGGGSGAGLGLAKIGLDATAKRDLSTLRRLSALFVDMARMVIAMNQTFLEEEQVVRITAGEYVKVRRDDIQGNVDLRVSISTPEKDAQQAEQLGMILQTNAASMDPELYKIVLSKMLDLQYLPEEAEKIRSFEPKPNPVQEETQKLELENARLQNEKLKAEMVSIQSIVAERATRSTENISADIKNKLAQAELRAAQAELALAQAELAKSKSDELDQGFLDKASGAFDKRKFANKEHDAMLKEEEAGAKAKNEFTAREHAAVIAEESKGADDATRTR